MGTWPTTPLKLECKMISRADLNHSGISGGHRSPEFPTKEQQKSTHSRAECSLYHSSVAQQGPMKNDELVTKEWWW